MTLALPASIRLIPEDMLTGMSRSVLNSWEGGNLVQRPRLVS